jgi:hypothetical protein
MKNLVIFLLMTPVFACEQHQDSKPTSDKMARDTFPHLVGGGCEGCEFYLMGMPANLNWETDIVSPDEVGERLTGNE